MQSAVVDQQVAQRLNGNADMRRPASAFVDGLVDGFELGLRWGLACWPSAESVPSAGAPSPSSRRHTKRNAPVIVYAASARCCPRRQTSLPVEFERRARVLRAALGFAALAPTEPELALLHGYLDTWRGIGDVVVGMARQDYDLQLTRYDGRGWRATFYSGRPPRRWRRYDEC